LLGALIDDPVRGCRGQPSECPGDLGHGADA
jgi:hypothetical protein